MSHIVKCLYCNKRFDRDTFPFVKIKNRYAHQECVDEHKDDDSKPIIKKIKETEVSDEQDKKTIAHREFFDCIRDACMGRSIPDWARLTKDEKNLVDKGYTISGLRKTFFYYYVIKNKPLPKKLVTLYPLIDAYEEACNYYKKLFEVNNRNQEKEIKTEKEIISIEPPKIREKKIKFFDIGE